MTEIHKREEFDVIVSIRHENLVAKGRLLKYLRSRPAMMYGRADMGPELPNGTKW